ncbi:thiamine phosphate synthase [Pseudoteredinibacter isoporae]|nr:thiamine phosphate synthase [Pseudoteredinibacter isoporae]NIB22613.1 thiamine phosphate synthase [Pseudoteredinibacter isoporae]
MVDALVIANMAVAEGIYHAKAVNHEAGPISAQGFPKSFWPHYVDLGAKQQEPMQCEFKDCTAPNTRIGSPDEKADELGLYPVVDRYQWLERLLPLGIHTIQLRIKDLDGQALKEEIEKSIALARESNCRLFINDHWELAIEMGAYGIHLGQEDLDKADLRAISQAGLRLGISNHTHFELIRCLAINPSYIACGPVFATQSKDMPWIPHGLNGLRYWCESLMSFQNRPLVAIGGINRENISEVAQCGSSGIALISAITEAESPEKATRELLQMIEHAREKIS